MDKKGFILKLSVLMHWYGLTKRVTSTFAGNRKTLLEIVRRFKKVKGSAQKVDLFAFLFL